MTIAEKALNKSLLYKGRILFDEGKMKYTDISDGNFGYCKKNDLLDFLEIKAPTLLELKKDGKIPKYKGICYLDGGRKGYYNLFDKNTVSKTNNKPFIAEEIKFLISNLCNGDDEAISWTYKAILYKYQNLNDVIIPALLFHGIQGTGKGLFMELMKKIFGEVNTQEGLTQKDLDSNFIPYHGKKLIVELNEIFVKDDNQGKKVMSKLKALINASKIMVEKKGVDSIPMDSIAWFIMSSNETIPIHLDGGDNSNRRFTVIETGRFIPKSEGARIVAAFTSENISSFIAYLKNEYGDIKEISALENESKALLKEAAESEGNLFFQEFEEQYPNIKYLTNYERDALLRKYRDKNGVATYNMDNNYEIKKFNEGLSFRYKKVNKNIKGSNTKQRGYEIIKEVEGKGYWTDEEWDSKFGQKTISLEMPNNF